MEFYMKKFKTYFNTLSQFTTIDSKLIWCCNFWWKGKIPHLFLKWAVMNIFNCLTTKILWAQHIVAHQVKIILISIIQFTIYGKPKVCGKCLFFKKNIQRRATSVNGLSRFIININWRCMALLIVTWLESIFIKNERIRLCLFNT